MIANIIQTFGSKIAIALISFGILSLNAHFLGPEGLGTIGLIVLGITMVQLVANLINGSIVYYSSRLQNGNILFLSYLWSLISAGIFTLINEAFQIFDPLYSSDISILAFLQSIFTVHLYFFLGKERISWFNLFSLLQSLLTVGGLICFYFLLDQIEVSSFINALYITYSSLAVGSAVLLFRLPMGISRAKLKHDFKKLIKYGFFIQAANTFQLLNYRLSYFFLDAFSGRVALGQFTAAIQLSESLLIPGRSIATVQYSRISARDNDNYAQRVTFLFMKLSFLVTFLGSIVLMLLPKEFFAFILGSGFSEVRILIICMAIGLMALSAEIILSHYFSGTGRQQTNSISAGIGLLVTLGGGLLLIPDFGALGAAVTTTLSYSSMFLFLFIMMNFQAGVSSIQFVPNKRDFQLLKKVIRKKMG